MKDLNADEGEARQSSASSSAAAPTECAQTSMNLSLLDPPRWGWAAVGGVVDLLTPQERSRRRSTKVAYRKQRRRLRPLSGKEDSSVDTNLLPLPLQSAGQGSITVAPVQPIAASKMSSSFATQQGQGQPQTQPQTEQQSQQATAAPIGNSSLAPPPPAQILENTNGTFPLNGVMQNSKMNGDPKQQEKAFWGMSLKRQENKKNNNIQRSKQVIEATVESVKDGVLDMFAYHRGREGMEPRDIETGELLCTQIATDTNHEVDAPKLVVTIAVEFPLEDETDTKDVRNSEATQMKSNDQGDNHNCDIGQAMYNESITWDLGDASTPSPLMFATNIADEYGLSFGQMMDLATSMQEQIDAHLKQNFFYSASIALRDPLGDDRRFAGPTRHTHRYDQVVRVKEGGIPIVKKRPPRLAEKLPRQKSVVSLTASAGSSRGKRRDERQYETIYLDGEEEIQEEFCVEVQKRGKEASKRSIAANCTNGTVGLLEKKTDFHCHICHKRANVTYNFACQFVSHAYCTMHCKNRLDICGESDSPVVFDYCPVCSLNCQCSSCCRKISGVARDFKRHCQEQNKKASEAVFDDVLVKCQGASSSRGVARIVKVIKRRIEEPVPVPRSAAKPATKTGEKVAKSRQLREEVWDAGFRPTVPKPPLVDFPREVCGLAELDPGTPDDYMKVYSAQGSFPVNTYPEAWTLQEEKSSDKAQGEENTPQKEKKSAVEAKEEIVESTSLDFSPSAEVEVSEDGNVDYCHICQTAGNLLCCDFCPRAFHNDCLQDDASSGEGRDVWRCIVCEQEGEGLEDDLVDGKGSLDKIFSTFLDTDVSSDETLKGRKVLSIIHEMLLKLIDYDFGFMFQQPVASVKGYKDIVKHPMDLGTVCSKLMNGGYCGILKQRNSFDDAVVAVLKDIELVWHNCFLFNSVDSAIYRMAGVHRRRAANIRGKSFDHLLSDSAKAAVQEYAGSCERKRGEAQNAVPSARENVLRAKRPKGKYKIGVKSSNSGSSKVVAILDPSSGRIVKMFSSVKSAMRAVDLLQKLGHSCEWKTPDAKSIIHRSSSDPSMLLFGYRWLPLEDFHSKKVKFPRASSTAIEMKHDSTLYVFFSIEEALSSSALPKDVEIDEIRIKLRGVPVGTEWVELFGIAWRRPVGDKKSEENNQQIAETKPSPVDDDMHLLAHSVVVKEDLVTRRKLVGFGSISAAYDDWMQTTMSSPTFPDESKSMETFKQYYLDGDRNVDGIVWRSTQPLVNQKMESGESKIGQDNSNGSVYPAQMEPSSSSAQGLQPLQKPSDEGILSETNSIEVLRNSQPDTNAMDVDASPDTLSKIGSAVALGKRKRPLTDDQNKQWGIPCGGASVNGVESPCGQKTVA